MAGAEFDQVFLGRHQTCDFLLHQVAVHLGAGVEIADDFSKAKDAHRHRSEAETVG